MLTHVPFIMYIISIVGDVNGPKSQGVVYSMVETRSESAKGASDQPSDSHRVLYTTVEPTSIDRCLTPSVLSIHHYFFSMYIVSSI